jgi:hypothetical protein
MPNNQLTKHEKSLQTMQKRPSYINRRRAATKMYDAGSGEVNSRDPGRAKDSPGS